MKSVFENTLIVITARKIFKCCILFTVIVLLFTSCGSSTGTTWQEQYDLGMQYLTEGDYEEAILAFTGAIETDSKCASLYIARGDVYLAWAEKVEANALADVVNDNFVEWEEISAEEGSYTLQELYENAQVDYEEAVALLESGEATDQDDDLLKEAKEKLEAAKEKLEEAKEKLEAANEELQTEREVLAEELVELAEKILDGDTSDEEKRLAYQHLERAKKLTEDEDVLRRIEELLSGVEKDSMSASDGQSNGDSVIAGTTWQEQYDLGMQYLESGDYTAAVTAFTAAIEIDETDIRAYTGLVQAYGIFDIEEVISAAWQVAEILGDSDSGQEQEDGTVEEFFSTLMFLVEGGLKQGEYESAEAICSFIIEIDEKRVDAYIGRVEVYLELDEQEKALEDCRKALDLLQQGETGSITEDELEALIAELTEN